ncbi:MAG TPA: GtrA family protein [Caulobacteraceae bacterium]|nr:GtrA family protein [Caulobacteraceae bacterium]
MSRSQLARQVLSFGAVGGAATATHAAVALAAHHLAGVAPLTANLIAYLTAVAISYFGNALITFGRPARNAEQFVRFIAVSLSGFAINQSVVFATVKLAGWPLWLALIPALGLAAVSSFLMSKHWAFRAPATET